MIAIRIHQKFAAAIVAMLGLVTPLAPINANLSPAFAAEAVSYDFNTVGDLSTFFNSYVDPGGGAVSQSTSGGISNSGAIEVANALTNTYAVFASKDGYSLGPTGSTYTFSAQMRSLGPVGYSGMGFTSVAPTGDNTGQQGGAPFRPNDSLGVSVHGNGFVFTNGATRLSGRWDGTPIDAGVTAVKAGGGITTGCDELTQDDCWYKVVFKITRTSETQFSARVELYDSAQSGTLDPTTAISIHEITGQSNSALTNAAQIFSYINFSGQRMKYFDNFQVDLAGGASVISAGAPVVLTSSASESSGVVTVSGNVTSDGGAAVTERGFVYGTSANPTTSGNKVISGTGTGTFSGVTPSLTPGTYYFRAYATNSSGTSYGSENQVTITSPTITFDSNLGTGTMSSQASRTATALNANTFQRTGLTFQGWSTYPDRSALGADFYADEASYDFANDGTDTLYAQWSIPKAARLFGATTDGTTREETIVKVIDADGNSLSGNIRGITTDGSSVFFMPSTQTLNQGIIREVDFSGELIADHTVSGAGNWFQGSDLSARDLTYSSGCIFVRENGAQGSKLYCIDTDDWSMTEIAVPTQTPPITGGSPQGLLAGTFWLTGNLIDFPDGRIGAVSGNNQTMTTGTGAGQCPAGHYCKILRLYSIAGEGASATLTWDEDVVLADAESNWPSDDHGIATDGTYLYQSHYSQGYKVFELRSGEPSYVVFNGNGSGACGADSGASGGMCSISGWTKNGLTVLNATYFGRDHVNKRYLMGDYNSNQFVYTETATDQPAGIGTIAAPSVPRSLTASPSDGQVMLAWLAPSSVGGGPIVSYTATASPGGATCTVSSTGCTITGLTNGTAYTFSVIASNRGGPSAAATVTSTAGTPSASSSGTSTKKTEPVVPTPVVTPTRPTVRLPFPPATPPAPQVLTAPVTTPSSVATPVDRLVSRVGGVPAPVTTTTSGDDELSVSTSSMRLSLKMSQPGTVSTPSDDVAPELTIKPGAKAAVSGSGLLPNTTVQVWLPNFSDRELGRLAVNADGELTGELSLSSSLGEDPLPIGRQTLQVTGYDADGNQTVVEMPVNIAQGPPTPEPNRQAGALPDLSPGQSLATSAGVPTTVAVTPFADQRVVAVDGGDWSLSVAVADQNGEVGGTSDSPLIRMTQSGQGSVTGDGFQPGTVASLWMFSDPTLLGTVTVAEDGSFNVDFLVDAQFLPVGEHTLQVQGVGTDGFIKAANLGVLVDAAPAVTTADSALTMIWWVLAAVILIALAIVVLVSRRRRQA